MSFARDYVLSKFFGEGSSGSGGNGGDLFLSINNRTIEKFVATENMYKLRPYMFAENTTLKSVDLSKLNAPLRTDVSEPFLDFEGLIGPYCFQNCSSLENIVLPELLDPIVAGNQAWIGGRAFLNCIGLKEFVTDKAGRFNSPSLHAFAGCTGLKKVIVPNFVSSNAINLFNGCTSLEIVDFGGGDITRGWFNNCNSLKVLIIRSATVTPLKFSDAFTGTPFASGGTGGTVYVPQALIEGYKQDTNWSALHAAGTCNYMAIEGSEYE
jgi:hypothetical protein